MTHASQLDILLVKKLLKLLAHCEQLPNFLFDLREFGLGDGADSVARNPSLIANLQNGRELWQGESDTQCTTNHLHLAAYYRHKAQQLRDRSAAHNAEADGYAKRIVFEPKTGIPGGLLRHCREWAWRYAEDAKKADAMAETHEKLAQEIHNAGGGTVRARGLLFLDAGTYK